MSHSVFQTAQIMPLAPTSKSLSSKPLQPMATVSLRPASPPFSGRRRMRYFPVRASSSALVDGDASAHLERCFQASPDAPSSTPSSSVEFGPTMKGGQYGAFGAVTLEKSKLDMSKKETKSSPQIETGGGGGNKGKGLSHGGGDGGDDGGDDDDYFDDFDEGDEGDEGGPFRRRVILEELFDRKFVDAVLNEWQKTIMDLPAGFRQAYEMGMVSSAQLVKFLAINARPTTARFISRSLPHGLSRAFIGRMIADPAFMLRLLLEQASTIGCSVLWEIQNRKERYILK
ncbi:protein RETICULATA-RELATED 1, chloroplastic-like [Salvia miltiorrhiza]|uniref:protein RETICULATA-RELATED 1, chloroplastic-like n=1 Tax=Salvia miltiorrhiza TaxID=226208 RepID=UPI0025ACC695|nr:protein RETICULATA-RELATED 1, chloroplastic-like [Salvia miltiorrhiza]